MPRVSVSISVLNQLEPLRSAIQSVVNQTFKDWECFVVDDGSSVSHESVVKSFNDPRIKFHRFPVNRGIPFGGLYGYKQMTGEFVQALSCDEIISPTKFEEQLKFFDENPDIDIIWGVPGHGPMGPVPEWEQVILGAHNRSKEHWIKTFLFRENVPIGGGSCMYRIKLHETLGLPDENLTAFSDFEWYLRVFKSDHKCKVLPYRWMNEIKIPGHVPVSVGTPENHAKLAKEMEYVLHKHQLILPKTDGMCTFGMPVYNHAPYIVEAIKSCLAQTDQNFELIIYNDGSTDNLEEVIKPFLDNPKITYHSSKENIGMAARGNMMVDLAKGDFFCLLASDDTMDPTFLEKCRKAFQKDPFLEFVSCQNDFMTVDGKPHDAPHILKGIQKAYNHTKDEWWQVFKIGNVYFGMGVYRTQAIKDVGYWNPDRWVLADYDLYLRLLPRYNFHVIEEPLTHTRITGKNQSVLTNTPTDMNRLRRTYYEAQKNCYQPRPKIIIATPFYELKGFSPYIRSLVDTLRVLTISGIDWEFMELSGDSYVHRARNSMCMNFLSDPWATDLFFIDSDMAWDVDAFMKILFRPEPVIGGTYPVKNKWDMWTSKPVIMSPEKDPHFIGIKLPDGGQLVQAYQLAGGFLRIKRSVLEKFVEYYPNNRYNDTHPVPEMRSEQIEFFTAGLSREGETLLLKDIESEMATANGSGVDLSKFKTRFDELKKVHDFVGEDYCFSNRLREMGVPLYIYPNATITHFGVQGWTGNFHTFMTQKPPGA